MQRASGTFQCRRFFDFAGCYCLRLCGGSGLALLAPAFMSTLSTLSHVLLASVPLRLLIRRQDRANLGVFLGAEGLAAQHYLMGLLDIGAERNGVALLASSASRVRERLCPGAERLRLR